MLPVNAGPSWRDPDPVVLDNGGFREYSREREMSLLKLRSEDKATAFLQFFPKM